MKLSHRTLMILASALMLLPCLGRDPAHSAEDKAKEETPSWRLPIDAGAAGKLQAAADYIRDEDWRNALRMLQHLLDGEPDKLTRLGGSDGKAERIVSVHVEAERLLASLPEAGRKAYQQTYGPRAAASLEAARTARDEEQLARILDRYLYTDAGPDALRELARRYFKDGRLAMAENCYARLLEHLGPARWSNDDLYQAAVAFHHDRASTSSEQLLKQLLTRNGQNLVRLGKRNLTAEQLRKEIEQAASSPKPPAWPIYRGDAARSNRGAGDPPLLEAMWRQSMFDARDHSENSAKERIHRAEKKLHQEQEPIIPAFSPLALTVVGTKGEKKPLLIYKNYLGVMAVDPRNGSLTWMSPSPWSLQRMLSYFHTGWHTLGDWLDDAVKQYPQIFFENSTVGTLSTDGQFIYVVEDLAVPPGIAQGLRRSSSLRKTPRRFDPGDGREIRVAPLPEDMRRMLPSANVRLSGRLSEVLEDAISHNRLYALSLAKTGALAWVLGEDEKDPLRDHSFLGPPLPLAGKLYMLVAKQQEIRLICLDPSTRDPETHFPKPTIVSTQTLGKTQEKLQDDPLRRTWAAHLAYGEGILVCPTNAGAVFGIDLLSRRLAWVYLYRQQNEPAQNPPAPVKSPHDLWKATAPVISAGKVVLAPPDDRSLYCLNLSDGSLLWSRKKGSNDVYLAGVYRGKVLIVGTNSVSALSLATGKVLWTLETGLPSGQGIATGDLYYLPLQQGSLSKQPEILVLNMNEGRVIAHNKTRRRTPDDKNFEVPGNLVFVEGKLISQSPWEIVAFPSLQDKLKEADAGVEQHPGDPARLLERAALRLSHGEQKGAIKDLRAALKQKPDRQTRRQARALLFEALSDWFAHDLQAAEASLKEYRELTEVDLEGLTQQEQAERRAEHQRRLRRYFLFVARLRESQGRLPETLQAYFDLGDAGPSEALLPLPADPSVKVRAALWLRGRIGALLKKAAPEQRKQMEADLDRRLKEVRDHKDEQRLRNFVELTGAQTAVGREGRLLLAERLLGQFTPAHFREAELLLVQVRGQEDDRIRAARAVEMLGRWMTMGGRMHDALYFYRLLRRDFGKVVLSDGKTGADVWNAVAADKRFLTYLNQTDVFAAARYRGRKETGNFPRPHEVFSFEHTGEELPFFRRYLLGLEIGSGRFCLLNRLTEKDAWTASVPRTSFQALLPSSNAPIWPRFRYHTQGHLVVLPVDNLVFGIDPVGRSILWQKDTLAGIDRSRPAVVSIEFDPRDGSPRLVHPDDWVQFPGQNLVLSPSVLCLATHAGLQGCDPLTGRLLWARADSARSVRLLGDNEHVFVVEEDARGKVRSTKVLRLADGATLPAPDFTAVFARCVQAHGRTLVLSRRTDKDGLTLQLYDILTGTVSWERTFAAKSLVMHSEEPRLAGVVEPDGKVHVIDVVARKEVMTGQMAKPEQQLRKVQRIHLLADKENYYLASYAPPDGEAEQLADERVSRESDLGRKGLLVNGVFHAFARTGRVVSWYLPIRHQRLVLEQLRESPLLFFTSYTPPPDPLDAAGQRGPSVSALCVHKLAGRVIYDATIKGGRPFYAVRVDPLSGSVEYVSPAVKIECQPRGEK